MTLYEAKPPDLMKQIWNYLASVVITVCAGTIPTVRIKGKMDLIEYRTVLRENQEECSGSGGTNIYILQDKDQKHTSKRIRDDACKVQSSSNAPGERNKK